MENHPVSCFLNIVIRNYPRGTSSVIYEKKTLFGRNIQIATIGQCC